MKLSFSTLLVYGATLLLSTSTFITTTDAKAIDYHPNHNTITKRTNSGSSSSSLTEYAYTLVGNKFRNDFLRESKFDAYAAKALKVYMDNPSQLTQSYLDSQGPSYISSLEFYTCKIKKCKDSKKYISKCIDKLKKIPDGSCKERYIAIAANQEYAVVLAGKCDNKCPSGKKIN
ncbi:hypothetical protein H4219_004954 [Mycoemilia scoparia]|uniref:Uncharacterized protein n=1 Tax=Mycoemilia scoparia TaxID=417184 RepID=A0A9W7ZPT2_9FUNG|nr:hypothetical protein H4219_004954 [Mycoemilia scoparia]